LRTIAKPPPISPGREGDRRRDEKAARFNANQQIGALRTDLFGQPLDRGAPRLRMRQQG
jgi:hypothetical protein